MMKTTPRSKLKDRSAFSRDVPDGVVKSCTRRSVSAPVISSTSYLERLLPSAAEELGDHSEVDGLARSRAPRCDE